MNIVITTQVVILSPPKSVFDFGGGMNDIDSVLNVIWDTLNEQQTAS